MTFSAARIIATRTVARRAPVQQQQKRGIVDYLTNYPDKVRLGIAIDTCFIGNFASPIKEPGVCRPLLQVFRRILRLPNFFFQFYFYRLPK